MKKLFYLPVLALCLFLNSCSDDDAPVSPGAEEYPTVTVTNGVAVNGASFYDTGTTGTFVPDGAKHEIGDNFSLTASGFADKKLPMLPTLPT